MPSPEPLLQSISTRALQANIQPTYIRNPSKKLKSHMDIKYNRNKPTNMNLLLDVNKSSAEQLLPESLSISEEDLDYDN